MKTLEFLKEIQNTSVSEYFFNKDIEEAIAELEELQNRSCENCKHCDTVYENIIHCQYFEELLPKEIGKCDMHTKKE